MFKQKGGLFGQCSKKLHFSLGMACLIRNDGQCHSLTLNHSHQKHDLIFSLYKLSKILTACNRYHSYRQLVTAVKTVDSFQQLSNLPAAGKSCQRPRHLLHFLCQGHLLSCRWAAKKHASMPRSAALNCNSIFICLGGDLKFCLTRYSMQTKALRRVV